MSGVRRPVARDAGQATVELVLFAPLLAALALLVGGLLAGYAAREAADQAAVAAAIAELQGRDPAAAARAASPGWARARVQRRGGVVRVRITPRLPRFVAAVVDADRRVVVRTGER